MSRRRTLGTKKKIALLVSAAAVAGGGAFVMASTSNAAQPAQTAAESTVCQGLATALGNNQRFIDGQRANPDAQSEARIANRQAVIEEIKRKQAASGCVVGESAQDSQSAQNGQQGGAQNGQGAQQGQGGGQQAGGGAQAGGQQAGGGAQDGGGAVAAGEQVCKGSTVTLSGEGGAPAASSNQFPAGTRLKVTNLDNNKSTTVEVTSVSGSCVLLNNAAFEQVREPGKFLIRRAVIEKVG
ncbi:septal ring lytic transglycosylase RlpA family protein [Streptomyces sp. XM83C]|jgi:hypothetical protein|uniref:Septal ring lytic transglycosylase RlpA family protein n=1 Tax=Streptomyces thermocoprophilus TaxID=78356 RepID=A0ABV5VI76_9ACTN|nr:septal ring lytic transglycosylase RlpA family protein [Streptomyces sp. XM83C]MCK1821321.1 septal ring lytic transglycosylase RlpA family protein [Streptomyces sp. XM83C]